MILAAHAIAISCYPGAVVIATAPFARPVRAPVTGMALALAAGAMYPIAHRDLKSRRFGTRKTNTFLDAGARVPAVDPRAREELRARGRGTGVVDAASYRSGVQHAVRREADAADEPVPADHVARTPRITNPGTDE